MLKTESRKYMNIFFNKILYATFFSFAISYHSFAMLSDNQEPLEINSDKFELDYTNGYAVYNGNVKLRQGTRNLVADKIFIYFDKKPKQPSENKTKQNIDDQNSQIQEIVAIGGPVEYTETLKNENGLMYAHANIMRIRPDENLVTLQDNAQIKQNGRRLTSNLLHYNIKSEVAYAPKISNKRNKLILGKKQPENNQRDTT